jgi:hypothetical protein
MLDWDLLFSREAPCLRCKGTFQVVSPIGLDTLAEVRTLLERGKPVSAIRLIRERTACGLRDAKGIFEHVTIVRHQCRNCRRALSGSLLTDCDSCGALNIDA